MRTAGRTDANQAEIVPWIWKQFMAAMRKANWRNDGQGVFFHKQTGAKFYAWTWTKRRQEKYGRGEAWYEFALDHTTPTEAPF